MEESRSRGNSGNEYRKGACFSCRGFARMPLLVCCCFILSLGAIKSTVEASSKGVRLLTSAMTRGGGGLGGHWIHPLHLEGLREEEGESSAGGWDDRRHRKASQAGELVLPLPPIAAMSQASKGDDAETVADFMSGSPWALVAVREYPGGKRHTLSFTPRLGRESGEEKEEDAFLEVEEEDEVDEADGALREAGVIVRRRTPPFAPRLGRQVPDNRRVIPFSPRLGRRRIRGSSGGEEAPQSPASGNPDHNLIFSPRLGRSSSQVMSGDSRSEGNGRASTDDGGTKDV